MLTDTQVRKLSYVPKKSTSGGLQGNVIPDRDGMYLFITPNGSKSFRFSYRFGLSHDPEKAKKGIPGRWTITYGRYPQMALAEAREKHEDARRKLAKGENPATAKKREKYVIQSRGDDSFKGVAERWYSENEKGNSQSWRDNNRRWLDKEVYPSIGSCRSWSASWRAAT
jgi:Arm domain-containing DNA-binding protein